jgi:aspartyl-tRNA(Asn)/glutamyl-tRNA(Gln) amidotransferase subunit A
MPSPPSPPRGRGRAAALDARHAAGDRLGPLAGVPFSVKNLFDVAGLSTRAGSRTNRERPPAEKDAPLIARLEAAGAVLVGALNMGEYAYDFTGENVHDGPSRNPHDTTRMTGGSSGGSGAAVAGRLVPLALGSDTNGSIRVPSSLCGIFGLKPTYGRLSRAGSFPFVTSLDHLGPFARNASDLAAAYDAMQGPDPADPVCAQRPAEPTLPLIERKAERLRIAIAGGYFRAGVPVEAAAAVAKVAAALGVAREIELPEAERARAAAYVITASEGAALHLDRLRRRAADYDPAVRDRLIAGAMIPAAMVASAQKFRRWYRDRVLALFDEVDAILAPATPCTAPSPGQETLVANGLAMPAGQSRPLHPATLLHRAAGGRGTGGAVIAADRGADRRRAVARGHRLAHRPRSRGGGRGRCTAPGDIGYAASDERSKRPPSSHRVRRQRFSF